jgi:hypothetical protein
LAEGLQHAGQIRNAEAVQAQQVQRARLEQWGQQQDSQARAAIAKDLPGYATDEAYARLRSAAPRALAKLGIDQAEANRLWHNGTIRSVPAQRMIAKLAAFELGQDRTANRAPVPSVQKPGTARPSGVGDMDAVARTGRMLDDSRSTNQALRRSVDLLNAQRRAGLIQKF